MILHLSNIAFRVHSPSMYEFVHSQGDDRVFVRYTGQTWLVQYCYASGKTIQRTFNSRDAAIDLIASRARP